MISNLLAGTEYQITVKAYDAAGNYSEAAALTVKILQRTRTILEIKMTIRNLIQVIRMMVRSLPEIRTRTVLQIRNQQEFRR